MNGRPTWTDCDEAGDNDVPNVFSPRGLVSRPDSMDETVPHTQHIHTHSVSNTLLTKPLLTTSSILFFTSELYLELQNCIKMQYIVKACWCKCNDDVLCKQSLS